jgi:hypothetical protein
MRNALLALPLTFLCLLPAAAPAAASPSEPCLVGACPGSSCPSLSPFWSFTGVPGYDFMLGAQAVEFGDFNGDHRPDQAVCGMVSDPSAKPHPMAYEVKIFYHNGTSGAYNATPDKIIHLPYSDANLPLMQGNLSGKGAEMAVGDIDGDGFDELVIGYRPGPSQASRTSQVDVYRGGSGGLSAVPAWSKFSASTLETIGQTLAVIPGFFTPGKGTLAVGVPESLPAGTHPANAGRIDLYDGGSGPFLPSTPVSIYGEQSNSFFSLSMNGAGDVDHDSRGDLIVYADYVGGMPRRQMSRLYLYRGGQPVSSPWWTMDIGDNSPVQDPRAQIVPLGDVNGDHFDDFAGGFFNAFKGQGTALIFYGRADGKPLPPQCLSEGTNQNSWYGMSITGPGDLNGDSYADLVVGDSRNGAGGGVSVYEGSAAGILPCRSAFYAPSPIGVKNQFGWQVRPAGDVNGDGRGDLLVTDIAFQVGTASPSGKVYVLTGNAGNCVAPLSPPPSPTRSPTPTATGTRTPSATPSSTRTPSVTRTATPTVSPSVTRSPASTATPSWSPTSSMTPTRTLSFTASPSPSATGTATPTFSPTPSRTQTPTATPTSTATPTPLCLGMQVFSEAGSDHAYMLPGVYSPPAYTTIDSIPDPPLDSAGLGWRDPAYAEPSWTSSYCISISGDPALAVMALAGPRAPGTFCDPLLYAGAGATHADWIAPSPLNHYDDSTFWYSRKVVSLPPGAVVTHATLNWAADNYAQPYLNGAAVINPDTLRGGWNTPLLAPIDVTSILQSAGTPFVLGMKVLNQDTGFPSGVTYVLDIEYCVSGGPSGPSLAPRGGLAGAGHGGGAKGGSLPPADSLAVAPNPAGNTARAFYRLAAPAAVRLRLASLSGNLVRDIELGQQAPGSHEAKLDLANLAPGIYFASLELRSEGGVRRRLTFKMAVAR